MNKSEILEKRKKYLYPTKVPFYKDPLHLKRAKGSRVWDSEGNEYLDVIGGIVSISVGHNHPRIKEKMAAMVAEDQIQHTTFLYLSEYLENFAEKLAEVAPGDLSKVYVTNSGSEANEMAVMSARVHTGENMMVALRHGYHGGTNVPMGLCGHSNWKYSRQPQESITHAPAPYCYRCPFNTSPDKCHLECAQEIKAVIETTTAGKIAGFIAEPVLGVGGFITPPTEYHKRAHEIVKDFGGLYISDEVQTGVGRTGKYFFGIEESGVVPDIISMAKGIGSGAPVGAIIAKPEVAESLKGVKHFNTFGGDPYQSMQAAEVIDIIRDENLISNSHTEGNYLRDGFKEMQKDFPWVGDVRGRGLMVGLEIVKDPKTKEYAPKETIEILEAAREEGLLLGMGSLKGNVIRITPSLNIARAESDELLTKMQNAFNKVHERFFK